jgi:hypothetical protein
MSYSVAIQLIDLFILCAAICEASSYHLEEECSPPVR